MQVGGLIETLRIQVKPFIQAFLREGYGGYLPGLQCGRSPGISDHLVAALLGSETEHRLS